MLKKTAVLLLALTMIPAAAQASIFSSVDADETRVQDAQANKGGFIIKRKLDDLKVDGSEKSLRGKTRIAVPFFRLNFVTSDKYRNTVTTGLSASRTSSNVKSELSGVEESVFQAVTDEMYQDFLRQCEKAGYEVVPVDELQNSEKFADLESDYPKIKKDVAKITANKFPFPGRFKNPSADISKQLDAVVLQVDLDVDYLIINKNEKRFNVLKDSSHVDVTQGVNVMGSITAFSGDKMTTIIIQQPFQSSRMFAALNDETSAMSKANDALVFASGWLTQGGLGSKRQTTRSYDIVADSQLYRLAVGDAMVQLNRDIAGTLQTLRDKA